MSVKKVESKTVEQIQPVGLTFDKLKKVTEEQHLDFLLGIVGQVKYKVSKDLGVSGTIPGTIRVVSGGSHAGTTCAYAGTNGWFINESLLRA